MSVKWEKLRGFCADTRLKGACIVELPVEDLARDGKIDSVDFESGQMVVRWAPGSDYATKRVAVFSPNNWKLGLRTGRPRGSDGRRLIRVVLKRLTTDDGVVDAPPIDVDEYKVAFSM